MARSWAVPDGYAPIDQLPDGLLGMTPAQDLIGPKKTLWGRMSNSWQEVKRPHHGLAAGCLAWTFHYIRKDPAPFASEDDTGSKTKRTVAVVDRGDNAPSLALRRNGFVGRHFGREPKGAFSLADEAFDREFLLFGDQQAARLLTPQVRAILTKSPRSLGLSVGGRYLVVMTDGISEQTGMAGLAHHLAASMPRR